MLSNVTKVLLFPPRVVNNTDMSFTENEWAWLNKGQKYNLNYKQKGWIKTLALEADTAVHFLPMKDQNHFRWQIADNLNRLYHQHTKGSYRNALKYLLSVVVVVVTVILCAYV